MHDLVKELFQLLSPSQKRRLFFLQLLVITMAIMELIGIASIGPFMALVGDSSIIETNQLVNDIYQRSGATSHQNFLFMGGLFVLVMLAIGSVISIITTWRTSLFAFDVGIEIGDRLYEYYLTRNWLFHAAGSSAQLTKQISVETMRVTSHIILPLIQMNSRFMLALFILIGLFIYNPAIAVLGFSIFTLSYFIIYRFIRDRIVQYGHNVSETSTDRFRLMNEGFGGIKHVLLTHTQPNFVRAFQKSGKTLARAQGVTNALGLVPRYFMELLAFGTLIGLVLLLIKAHDGALDRILPVLAIYALAGFKLLPALQQIYANITRIRGNIAAFDAIRPDLMAAHRLASSKGGTTDQHDLPFRSEIRLQDIRFTYPGKTRPALNGITLAIPARKTIGLVGESGSGKSTAIDLLLGLIDPDAGKLLLDGRPLGPADLPGWQQKIGFVPQSIFLSESSIAENIAFGLDPSAIDHAQVQQAIRLANLSEFVSQLPDGLNTRVGERGVQLSGGQRQRIGIARAIYNNPDVIVFDEATSALDGLTEKIIMDAIHDLSGTKTIVMVAHRLKTVQGCDIIYLFDNGRISATGTYEELLQTSDLFRNMARHA